MDIIVKDHPLGQVFRPLPASDVECRGRVVLVHGLNVSPKTMDPLAGFLARHGYVTLRLALSGHREKFTEFLKLRPEMWLADIEKAVASFNSMDLSVRNAPLHGVGFSLGGLLLSHHARMHQAQTAWQSLSLLAPAFTPRFGGGLPLGILPRWLPYLSFAPRRFRRWSFCPHNGYRSVAELMRAHNLLLRQNFVHDPSRGPRCLVMIHLRDELIQARRLAESFYARGLSQYEVRYLTGIHQSWRVPRHLICHPDVLQPAAWQDICHAILENCRS